MMINDTEYKLRLLLEAAFAPTLLSIENDSHEHAGHAESGEGGATHFQITIASAALEGKSRVAQHRAIYATVDALMDNPIHALAIRVVT